jgi:hypothetical protein
MRWRNDPVPLPKWSWDEAAEGKRNARAGDRQVRLWRVEAAPSIKDPRGDANGPWEGCQVLAFTARFIGAVTALVQADAAGAARLRSVRSVRLVELSGDRRYFDDRSQITIAVSGGWVCAVE